MGWAADLGEILLRCDVASGPRLIVILLGAIASAVTITLTSHTLYRRVFGPSGPVRRAADALRAEGENRAQQRDLKRALELYNLSILMNSRSAHVYYLRGVVREQRGEMNRAIADWKRCRDRLSTHFGAREKLLHFEPAASRTPHWRLAYAAVGLAALIVLIGLWAARHAQEDNRGSRATHAQHSRN
jgi:hypothetical protein